MSTAPLQTQKKHLHGAFFVSYIISLSPEAIHIRLA